MCNFIEPATFARGAMTLLRVVDSMTPLRVVDSMTPLRVVDSIVLQRLRPTTCTL